MSTLGGAVCIRNGNQLDYCWREAIKSLLPVCDEVVVCDGESTDGTQEEIRDWAVIEPKIKLCVYPWPNPVGDIEFWVKWLNYAREHLSTDYHFQLDADEVLSEKSYPEVLSVLDGPPHSVWVWRRNFWADTKHLIPPGHCCGHRVVRIAPSNVWLASDGCNERGNAAVAMALHSEIEIFHYGFLRKRKSIFQKAKELQRMFFGAGADPRMDEVEDKDGNWMRDIKGIDWINQLVDYNGDHPAVIHQWLRERGHKVK